MAKKTKKGAGGRPSKYDRRFVEEARKLALLGATDDEMAAFWDVSVATLNTWKSAHPEFLEALKEGKLSADAKVAERLYSRATGYSNPHAVKIFMPAGADEPVYAPFTEHYPPDVTAAIFWLKNRQRWKWRDRQEHEHTGKDGGPIETVSLVKYSDEQLDQLERILTAPAGPISDDGDGPEGEASPGA
jgi:hypothetical protein